MVGVGAARVGPAVRRAAPGRAASVPRVRRRARTARRRRPATCSSTSARTGCDLCFELAQRLTDRLAARARVVDEVHGFRSFDERDLLGFVDGTENPEGGAARGRGADRRRGPGVRRRAATSSCRSTCTTSTAWDALPVEEQERGDRPRRSSATSSCPTSVKPANSHVALNTIVDEDGEERQIMRFNMPFGRVGAREFGTYFIGYARTPGRDRADADEHVRRRAAGQPRPHPGLLDRGDRQPVLRSQRRLPRRPAGPARAGRPAAVRIGDAATARSASAA